MEQKIYPSHEFVLNDETLVALIAKIEAGDSSALITLYDATNRLLFGIIMRILGERTLAEETLLDVYTQIWRSAPSDPGLPPLERLLTLARASAVARLYWSKRNSRKQETEADAAASVMTVAPEQQKTARSSLDALAPAQRELLEWAYYGGMSCAAIAAQAGKPLGAVKSHIRIGLSEFGERFRPAPGREESTGPVTGGAA